MSELANDSVWYRAGLQFECTQCGHCCGGGVPGFVWVDDERISAMAGFLGITFEAFTRRYVRQVGSRLSLIEKPNYDCVFWEKEKGCTIYPVRPGQCRTFPFWTEYLERPADWESVKRACEGVGQGSFYPVERIQRIVRPLIEFNFPTREWSQFAAPVAMDMEVMVNQRQQLHLLFRSEPQLAT